MIQVTKGETELHAGRRAHLIWDDTVSRKVSGIYKITSPTGRVYIGQARNIYKRLRQYMLYCNEGRQVLLYRSFERHGIDNHNLEIIQHLDFYNKELLDDLEKHYIQIYCSFVDVHPDETKKGLNLTTGGSHKSIASKLTCDKRSRLTKGMPKPNHWYKPTEEHKQAIRNGILGIKRERTPRFYEMYAERRMEVHRFDRDGKYLDTFEYGNSPELKVLGFHKAGVNKCCSGAALIYKDHFFSYDRNFKPSQEHLNHTFRIKVYRYTLEGKFINEYAAMYDVRLDGFASTTIRSGLLNDKQCIHRGFIFSKTPPKMQE